MLDKPTPNSPIWGAEDHHREFEPGQIVALKSNPLKRGAVVSVVPSMPENRFEVFIGNGVQTFYASQLEADEQQTAADLILPFEEFHAYLTALQIQYPSDTTLYSLNTARIDYVPYQFRPVLRFIRSDRPRLLIADGVGVGKTIEAGLILRELQARREIHSILIICPRPLVIERKWENEMKRFDERFIPLDGRSLQYCIDETHLDGVWPEQYQRVILPYSLFSEASLKGVSHGNKKKRRRGLLDLDPPPLFDVVIVDEAHHIRHRNTSNYKAVRFFCDHAESVVFLSATPIQTDHQDLFVLLNALRPDLIIDRKSFEHMAEPNPYLNHAIDVARAQESDWHFQAEEALDQAAATTWGQSMLQHNPEFKRIRKSLTQYPSVLEERVSLIHDLENLHTFSGIVNRTRRRDIGDFTVRKPETAVVEFTPAQKKLHDAVIAIQSEIFASIYEESSVKFLLTTIRRQVASCLFGLVPFLTEILNRHLDDPIWGEIDNTEDVPGHSAIGLIEGKIASMLEIAHCLDSLDPKLERLRYILRDKQTLPNNKVMLFSSFRHTLNYLQDHLKRDGFRVAMMHGGIPDEDRVDLRNRFEKPKEQTDCLDILLLSEIGCEGLDYQFCDCIINYDLPWNPMRIEQRIGRIDRIGQRSETIAIFNLITPGTVDADIHDRCLTRIGVFNRALGGSEEILGEITREIRSIAENFTLDESERQEQLQQLADNKIRLIREQGELEQRQLDLFGLHVPQDYIEREVEQASNFWLSPLSIQRLISIYLGRIFGQEQEFILGEKSLKTLRLAREARTRLLQDYQALPRQNTMAYRDWENWLRGGVPRFQMTFESTYAAKHPSTAFITPLHPLAKQAAVAIELKARAFTALKVYCEDLPKGEHEFAIYQWHFHGIRENLMLRPVAALEKVSERLSSLLEHAEQDSSSCAKKLDPTIQVNLEQEHYRLWLKARMEHRQKAQRAIEFQRESLTTSHRARIALLQEQEENSTSARIRKMHLSQIASAEADYRKRMKELDNALTRSDITFKQVAYSVMSIERKPPNAE